MKGVTHSVSNRVYSKTVGAIDTFVQFRMWLSGALRDRSSALNRRSAFRMIHLDQQGLAVSADGALCCVLSTLPPEMSAHAGVRVCDS